MSGESAGSVSMNAQLCLFSRTSGQVCGSKSSDVVGVRCFGIFELQLNAGAGDELFDDTLLVQYKDVFP